MWISEKRLVAVIGKVMGIEENEDSKVSVLEKKILSLKDDIGELELKKRLEEREIKHLVKMKEEKMDIEAIKTRLSLQGDFQTKEMELQKKYHSDILSQITKAEDKFQDIYKSILERLPNVNVEMKKKL